MFFRERFNDFGLTYVLVDAHEYRRSWRPIDPSLERVPSFEARWVLEAIVRREPRLLARLLEALNGMRLPASGAFALGAGANTDAFLARMLDAFGVGMGVGGSDQPAADFARFYLLRPRRGERPVLAPQESPEGRRIGAALTKFGRQPFTHRGDSYQLQRAGRAEGPRSDDPSQETLSEAQLLAILRGVLAEPALDAHKRDAVQELLLAAEAQRARTGTTELLLLRRQRFYARGPEDSGPNLTPSQLRRALARHWIEVAAVDPDGKPVSGVAVELELADGAVQTIPTNADGFARFEPVPAGDAVLRLRNVDGSKWRALDGPPSQPASRDPGLRWHQVVQGECLSKIAQRFGSEGWKPLWDHPQNEPLRKRRNSPHVLMPGDRVAVPGVKVHEIVRPTDATHRIELKDAAEMELQLRLHGGRQKGLAGLTYRVAFTHQGKDVLRPGAAPTGGDGLITERVPVGVEAVVIALDRPKQSFHFLVGHLDPARDDESKQHVPSGVEARLSALGYGSSGGAEGLRQALALFQRDQLDRDQADGSLDDPTAQKLLDMYGV